MQLAGPILPRQHVQESHKVGAGMPGAARAHDRARGHIQCGIETGAYSDPSRPLIPTQVGHPFRRNAATDSDRKSATFPSPLGIGGRHPSE